MTPLTKIITAVLFIGLFAISVACEAKTNANTKGKYHLVYLVSVPKLAVGKKVYVEPLFLTNGDILVPFYDYCRWYTKNALINFNRKHPVPKYRELRVSTSKKFLDDYCNGVPVTLSERLYTLNNYGEEISIRSVQYVALKTSISELEQSYSPPFFTDRGVGHIVKIKNKSHLNFTKYRHPTDLDRHFLLSTDQKILEDIVPVRVPDQKIVDQYLEKAYKYGVRNKGIVRHPRSVLKRPKMAGFINSKVHIYPFIYGDYDNDSKIDIVFGIKVFQDSKSQKRIVWLAIGMLYGDGHSNYRSYSSYEDKYIKQYRNGFSVAAPLSVIKIDRCFYNIFYTGLKAYRMFSIGKTDCGKYTMKKYYLSTLY